MDGTARASNVLLYNQGQFSLKVSLFEGDSDFIINNLSKDGVVDLPLGNDLQILRKTTGCLGT